MPNEERSEYQKALPPFEKAVDKCVEEKIKFLQLWSKAESSYLSLILKEKYPALVRH